MMDLASLLVFTGALFVAAASPGPVMKSTGGKANPAAVNDLLKKKLGLQPAHRTFFGARATNAPMHAGASAWPSQQKSYRSRR